MEKQTVVQLYNGGLLGNKKEGILGICNTMDGP